MKEGSKMKFWLKILLICFGIGIVFIFINGMIGSNVALLNVSTFLTLGCAICFFIVGIILYFIPTLIAEDKKHRNIGAIGVLNLFVGWTFIGWVICLVWAVTNQESANEAYNAKDSNKYDDIEKLIKLKEAGAITQEEFEIEKAKLLK